MKVFVPLTITFGVCGFTEDSTPDGLVNQADEALYQGQGQGKNRVALWEDQPVASSPGSNDEKE